MLTNYIQYMTAQTGLLQFQLYSIQGCVRILLYILYQDLYALQILYNG